METESVFVDTGAWFALADGSDKFHHKATTIYPRLLKAHHHLTTTNLVIAETYLLVRRALGHRAAMTLLDNISTSPRILKIYSEARIEEAAIAILKRYEDQDFSYTDAVSFVVMDHFGIKQASSFDRHFLNSRFHLNPLNPCLALLRP
ncbi:MAG: type II toxin-antitoxin system VapC family toxin [Deltaproteobacteria bacterium]|nr:type II toxin-antitoxin system VapC family toxin [Deltaproteobacteria bacterium]MBW2154416.1 type II toxin-antitoxin system VapC family toxin [Deltaproteobacteria bacterium]